MMRHRCLLALAGTIMLAVPSVCPADTAVQAEPFAPATFVLNTGRTGGWRFTVDATVQLTHLGLFDWNADGLQGSYPIGVWDEEGVLLTSAVMPAGGSAPLIDGMRYVEVPDAILTPGKIFTIGYFASEIFATDRTLHAPGWHAFHPFVHQVGVAVSSNGAFPDMVMPTVQFTENWLGPGFQFQIVPAQASWLVLAVLGFRASRRRK